MRWQRFFIALSIAAIIAIACVQQDKRFHKQCEEFVKNLFEHTFECTVVHARFKGVNLFTGNLWAEEIEVESCDGNGWRWKANQLNLKTSWWFLLLNKKIGLDITLHNVEAITQIKNQQPLIMDHVKRMIESAPGLPIALRTLNINDSVVATDSAECAFKTHFNAHLFHDDFDTLFIRVLMNDGYLNGLLLPSFEKINIKFDARKKDGEDIAQLKCNAQGTCPLIKSDDQVISLKMALDKNKFSGSLRTVQNNLVSVNGNIKDVNNFHGVLHGKLPLSMAASLYFPYQGTSCVDGHCSIENTFGIKNGKPFMTGTVAIDELSYRSLKIGSAHLALAHRDEQSKGTLVIDTPSFGSWNGSFSFDIKAQDGAFNGALRTPVSFNLFAVSLEPEKSSFKCRYNRKDGLSGSYQLSLFDHHDSTTHLFNGSFNATEVGGLLEGKHGDNTCRMVLDTSDDAYQLSARYIHPKKGELIGCSFDSDRHLKLSLDYRLIRLFIERLFNISIKGEGVIKLDADYKDGLIKGVLHMTDGSIQVAPTYNFIKNAALAVTIDPNKPSIVLKHGSLDLYEGSIKVPRAVIMLNENGIVDFAHVPLILEKVFLNLQKECFLIISGTTLLCKNLQGASIKGRLLLDKAKLKKNIFSVVTSKQLVSPFKTPFENTVFDGSLDLAIITKKPMSIKTTFIDTDATINWRVRGTCSTPTILGKIGLSRGSLSFPYKPLHIMNGALYFSPSSGTFDPEVSFVAKGRVRQFDVTLRVIGSLLHPHISLESTPPLTEEQIITLLLIGSESGSLSLIMPTLIMNNMRHLLFGPELSLTRLESYFKSLLAPLKNIRIVPKFTDQTARGGLRGAIEIDINDQLHGLIQKNFSQPEDMLFEVEYILSDDITVRAIRDEHGDLGGEVEMRWKF